MTIPRNDDQKEILQALNQGKLKRSKDAAKEMKIAKKDARINIRLSGPDLKRIKRRAAEEGMPYQTLIASVLHKFVTGRLSHVS